MDNDTLTAGHNLTSLQTFLISERSKYPHATGRYTMVLSALSLAGKFIAARCRRARLEDVLGAMGSDNIQGEAQQKLDVIANEALLRSLGSRPGVAVVASEEDDDPIVLTVTPPVSGPRWCSSTSTALQPRRLRQRWNHLQYPPPRPPRRTRGGERLQPGLRQVGAGYVLYGPSTVLVLTTGTGVQMFVLDPTIGSFLLVDDDVRIPEAGKSYSMNTANLGSCPEGYQRYVEWANGNGYSMRYAGAMVADVHRILMKGGVFLYPPTASAPIGKLRLMYECNPMAMLMEQAGGKSFSGTQRTMEIQPNALHQRVPVVLGSPDEVDHVLRHISG